MVKSSVLLVAMTLCVIMQLAYAQLSEKLLNSEYVKLHNEPLIPRGWTRFFDHANIHPNVVGEVLSTQRTKITFALHCQNLEVLNSKFEAITDPDSPQFRKFMTMDEVAKLTSPHSSSKSIVMEYIKSIPEAKIVQVSAHENFVTVDMPLKSIDRYFKTKMTPFVHKESGMIIYRSEQGFSLPQTLSFAVKTLIGVHNFPVFQHKAKKNTRVMDSSSTTTPQALWKRYNMTLPTSTSPKNSQAVGSFLGQYVSVEDLLQFQQTYNLPTTKPTIIGPNEDSNPGVEAALDIQYIISTGYLINTTINSTPKKYDDEDPFMYWAIAQQKMGDKSAWVHSISYGGVEKYMPKDYLTSLDLEFQKLTITGRSILIASGDNGARCSDSGDAFEPEWPTSSPFITSVGATRPSDQYFERSVSWGGGGFSAFYPRPKYQADAVSAYLAQNSVPPTSFFNVNGRMYPDIAALGVDYQVVVNGQIQSVDGTSASTPCVSGLIAQLNDLRFKAGKGPLGFLNPWLYKVVLNTKGATFDIVQGNNAVSPCPGFNAVTGADPISGVGVPNFAVLAKLALQSA